MVGMIAGASQINPAAAAYTAARRTKWMLTSKSGVHLTYGVTFRFRVTLDGVDTGDWSGCSGLKVDFKPEQLRSGGSYTSAQWMPGEITYPRLVLRRAIDAKGSEQVQDWLRTQALRWTDQPYDPKETGGSAVVVLYDADNDAVMRWVFHGVHPASWSGPDLDAAAGKVALETLELVHSGFQVDSGHISLPLKGSSKQPAHLKLEFDPKPTIGARRSTRPLEFPFNPDQIGVTFAARGSKSLGDQGDGKLKSEKTTAWVPTYTISKLNLFPEPGRSVMEQAELLFQMAGKAPTGGAKPKGAAAPAAGAATARVQPRIYVSWGAVLPKKAMKIAEVTIAYSRFLPDGTPIRAVVNTLKLEEWPEEDTAAGARNPTSGGIAGRRTHRLTLGESLASLSQEYYGNGLRWREIAEANSVDDPGRLRPGTLLFLPALTELTDNHHG